MWRARAAVVMILAAAAVPASAAVIDQGALSMLTELITVELSKRDKLSVLSSSDVREVVALEGQKQAMGCEESASCLAEVADAMGARFVVFGQLGRLGSVYILSLHLFDSEAATAAGRVVTKAATLEALSEQVEDAVERLLGQAQDAMKGDGVTTVLVLELKPASGVAEAAETEAVAPPPDEPLPWLLIGGATSAGLGGATVLAGLAFGALGFQAASEAESARVQLDAAQKKDAANAWAMGANVAVVAGTVLLAAGAGAAALGLFLDGE